MNVHILRTPGAALDEQVAQALSAHLMGKHWVVSHSTTHDVHASVRQVFANRAQAAFVVTDQVAGDLSYAVYVRGQVPLRAVFGFLGGFKTPKELVDSVDGHIVSLLQCLERMDKQE